MLKVWTCENSDLAAKLSLKLNTNMGTIQKWRLPILRNFWPPSPSVIIFANFPYWITVLFSIRHFWLTPRLPTFYSYQYGASRRGKYGAKYGAVKKIRGKIWGSEPICDTLFRNFATHCCEALICGVLFWFATHNAVFAHNVFCQTKILIIANNCHRTK